MRTLERLLDASSNLVCASSALVVARHRHKDWDEVRCTLAHPLTRSPCPPARPPTDAWKHVRTHAHAACLKDSHDGAFLLDCCIKLVNAPESERVSRERGVEALSVLCLKLAAK